MCVLSIAVTMGFVPTAQGLAKRAGVGLVESSVVHSAEQRLNRQDFRCLAGVRVPAQVVIPFSYEKWFGHEEMAMMSLQPFDPLFLFVEGLKRVGRSTNQWAIVELAGAVVLHPASVGKGVCLAEVSTGSLVSGKPVVTHEFYRHVLLTKSSTRFGIIDHGLACHCIRGELRPHMSLYEPAVIAVTLSGEHLGTRFLNAQGFSYQKYADAVLAVLGFPGLVGIDGYCYLRAFPACYKSEAARSLGKWPKVREVQSLLQQLRSVMRWEPPFADFQHKAGVCHLVSDGKFPDGLKPSDCVGGFSLDDPIVREARESLQQLLGAVSPAIPVFEADSHVAPTGFAKKEDSVQPVESLKDEEPQISDTPVVRFGNVQVGRSDPEWASRNDQQVDVQRAVDLERAVAEMKCPGQRYLDQWSRAISKREARPEPPREEGVLVVGNLASRQVPAIVPRFRSSRQHYLAGWKPYLVALERSREYELEVAVLGTRFVFEGGGLVKFKDWEFPAQSLTWVPTQVGSVKVRISSSHLNLVKWVPIRSGLILPMPIRRLFWLQEIPFYVDVRRRAQMRMLKAKSVISGSDGTVKLRATVRRSAGREFVGFDRDVPGGYALYSLKARDDPVWKVGPCRAFLDKVSVISRSYADFSVERGQRATASMLIIQDDYAYDCAYDSEMSCCATFPSFSGDESD